MKKQLNNKFEEILEETRINKNLSLTSLTAREEDAESIRPGPSDSEHKHLRRKHESNTEFDGDKCQDILFQCSVMNKLRQPLER